MLQFFQHHDPGAFAQDESISVFIKWNRRTEWIFCFRQRRQAGKSSHACGADAALCSACQHNIRVAVLDRAERIPDAVGPGRAGCHNIGTFAFQTELDRYIPCRHVGDHHRHHQRIHP